MQQIQVPTSFSLSPVEYTLIKFGATWCGPCKRVKPAVESLLKRFPSVGLKEVDVDLESPDHLQAFPLVKLLPTFFLARSGGPGIVILMGTVQGPDTAAIDAMLRDLCK